MKNKPYCDIDFSEEAIEFYRKGNRLRYLYASKIIKKLKNKTIVADIGCFGGVLYPFLKEAGCETIEGFDVDEKSVYAASRLYDKAYVWNIENQKAPVEDERYDIAIALEVIEHLYNIDNFLEEVKRILKIGGYFIVSTPNMTSLYNRFRVLIGKMPFNAPSLSYKYVKEKGLNPSHAKLGNMYEWKFVFESYGFKINSIKSTGNTILTNFIGKIKPSLGSTLFFILNKQY